MGEIDELFDSQNKRGTNKGDVIIKPKTRTVLFWNELANLSDGRKEEIILEDSSSMMHRTYEAYFNDNGTIFGIYANMID